VPQNIPNINTAPNAKYNFHKLNIKNRLNKNLSMLSKSQQLAQLRPDVTTPVVALTASINTEITLITVCNTTSNVVSFSLYHDDIALANAFNDDNVLYKNKSLVANETFNILGNYPGAAISLRQGLGRLAVQSDTANALNFTVYGSTASITG
jgi:hypothetical protein